MRNDHWVHTSYSMTKRSQRFLIDDVAELIDEDLQVFTALIEVILQWDELSRERLEHDNLTHALVRLSIQDGRF